MQIVYDEVKRRSNLTKHRLDFAELRVEFFEEATIIPAKLDRYKAIGWFDDRLVIVVIVKPLGTEAISVLSMRPAKQAERDRHW
jgi:uncharacterized protein